MYLILTFSLIFESHPNMFNNERISFSNLLILAVDDLKLKVINYQKFWPEQLIIKNIQQIL